MNNDYKIDKSNAAINAIVSGGIIANPEYNPKTKKGRQQPKYIKDRPHSIDENLFDSSIKSREALGFTPQDLGLTENEYTKYTDYDVIPTPYKTIDDINRQRAENQSAVEQFGNFLIQAIGSEIVIGTGLGLSNLADAIINVFKNSGFNKGEDDFTNPVSSYLESLQDDLKNRFEIYREDPNATWAITDTGWWADNAVSIASTASMLFPTLMVSKGLGAIGRGATKLAKGSRFSKIADLASVDNIALKISNKFGKKFESLSDAGKLADQIRSTGSITTNALMSRTMEGYLEAREAYKQIQEDTLNQLKNLDAKEREQFFINNPELKDKSDEEIANHIASISASENFRNDYWMLAMDALQFRALRNMYKGINRGSNAEIALAKKKAKDELLGRVTDNTNKSLMQRIKDSDFLFKAKYLITHPQDGLLAIQWSEGFEEGFQGVQTERAKETAKRYFDPNHIDRDMASYILDPSITEQAFWGVIGSLGFAGAGRGLHKLKDKIDEWTSDDKELFLRKLAKSYARTKSIEGWATEVKGYIDAINLINDNKNPFKFKVNDKGERIKDENGNDIHEDLEDTDKDILRDKVINQYLTDLVFNAMDTGNYDIFREFITDPEITKHINQTTGSNTTDSAIEAALNKKITDISNYYTENIHKIRTTIQVKNPFVGNEMARLMTRSQLMIDDFERESADLQAKYDELVKYDDNNYDPFVEQTTIDFVSRTLAKFDAEYNKHQQDFNDNKISQQAYNKYAADINNKRATLLKWANENLIELGAFSGFSEELKNNINNSKLSILLAKFNEFKSQKQLNSGYTIPIPEIQKIIGRRIRLSYDAADIKSQLPVTKEDFEREYEEVGLGIDKYIKERYNNAVDDINKWIESQTDLKAAKIRLYNNQVPELQEQLDTVKIGYISTKEFWAQIDAALMTEEEKRNKQEEERKKVNEGNRPLNEEESKKAIEEIEEEPESKEEIPFTGEEKQTESTESKKPTEPVEPLPPPAETQPFNPDEAATEEFDRPLEPEPDPGTQQVLDEFESNKDFNEIDLASKRANSIVKDIFKRNPTKYINLDINKEEDKLILKELIDEVVSRIQNDNISPQTKRKIANEAVVIMMPLLTRKFGNEKSIVLAKAIAAKIKSGSLFSTTGFIEDIESFEDEKRNIEEFLNDYVIKHNISTKSKYGPIIDLYQLFWDVTFNKEINQIEAINFFRNFYNFILNHKNDINYRFYNINRFKKLYNNPQYIKDTLMGIRSEMEFKAKYEHISAPSTADAKAAIEHHDFSKPVEAVYTPTNRDGTKRRSISVRNEYGEEMGYIATVTKSEDNNTFTLDADTGLIWDVTYNEDGTLSSTFDELFLAITQNINKNEELANALLKDSNNGSGVLSYEETMTILNNSIIQDLINKNKIKFKKGTDTYNKAKQIKNIITNILLFQHANNTNKLNNYDMIANYYGWLNTIRKNYEFTHKLMNQGNTKIMLRNAWEGGVNYDTTEYDCNTRGFTAKDNPIIGVVGPSSMIAEGVDEAYPNPAGFEVGEIGFRIRDSQTGPGFARITSYNPITSNKEFSKLLKEEFKNMITRYVKQDNYSFEEFKKDLLDLVGGPNVTTRALFRGLSIIHNNQSFGIQTKGFGNFLIKVNKFNTKTRAEQHHIIFSKTGNKENANVVNSNNVDRVINLITDTLISNLTFNGSFFTIINNNSKNVANTKYMYIDQNGKFVVNIGGVNKVYDSFTDFALKENAFKTNQEIVNGSYFSNDAPINSLYLDVEGSYYEPSSQNQEILKYPTIDSIKSNKSSTDLSTEDVLETLQLPKEIIKALTGNNIYGISLVPETIRYDKSLSSNEDAVFKQDGNIYIGNRFLNNSNNTNYIISKLAHENIHKYMNSLPIAKRERILNSLEETYNAFVAALEKDINDVNSSNHNVALVIKQQLVDKGFSIENYSTMLSKKARTKFNKLSKDEQRIRFMEEWLTESLTQKVLANYLNNVTYGNATVSESKSILQKILDILLQLFNGKNISIKNNTILARQWQLIGDEEVTNQSPVEESTNTSPDTSKQTNEENKDTTKENEDKEDIDEELNDDDFDDDDITDDLDTTEDGDSFFSNDELNDLADDLDSFSITDFIEETDINTESTVDNKIQDYIENPTVNSDNFILMNNINDFISKFDEDVRPIIKEMIEKGEISYICF